MITDESIMPFGKYKGEAMANIPPDYLLWLLENGNTYGDMKQYLEDNRETFKQEIAYNNKKYNR
jgi:uncharacterized protein (DUF3820 family)